MKNGSEYSPKICVIGAGFSGICAGIKLQTELKLSTFTIYDENNDVGGTWLTHTYPGCACDISSHVYSYSFELNPDWSTSYATQPEILDYLKRVAAKHKLYLKIKFNQCIKSTIWDETINKWRVLVLDKNTDSKTELIYDIIICGVGGLRVPQIPSQFQSFKGPLIHSATWDSSIDLKDKVIAVIGSGCSAVQIIPEIEPKVKKLISFQRHPAWVVPILQFDYSNLVKWVFAKIPFIMWLYRLILFFTQEIKIPAFKIKSSLSRLASWYGELHLSRQIPNNPELQKKLTPNYQFGCKRVSPSNKYYKSLSKSNVEVITSKITSVRDHQILTEDGNEYNIDVLILATGYKIQDYFAPLKIVGRKSKDILAEWQSHGPVHYLGITGSYTPNFFGLLGPNTAYGHNSVIFPIECQMNWIIEVLKEMRRRDSKVVVVKEFVDQEYTDNLLKRMKGFVWSTQCDSWYADQNGIVTTLYPGSALSYWNETRKLDCSKLQFY